MLNRKPELTESVWFNCDTAYRFLRRELPLPIEWTPVLTFFLGALSFALGQRWLRGGLNGKVVVLALVCALLTVVSFHWHIKLVRFISKVRLLMHHQLIPPPPLPRSDHPSVRPNHLFLID